MDFTYIDYTITQSGKELTTSSAIKLQKYENRMSRLVFEVEDWLADDARLYAAFQNPETKRYHYEPILYDSNENIYYLIIGTSITYYPSKHKMLLIGVEPSFELDDNITFDLSSAIYVSREFNKIVVLDNFLSDEALQVSMPNIDIALDDLVVLHDNTIAISIQTADDCTACSEYNVSCSEYDSQCSEMLSQCTELENSCSEILNSCVACEEKCESYEESCSDIYNNVNELFEDIKSTGKSYTSQFSSYVNQASKYATQCSNYVTQASKYATQAKSYMDSCNNYLTQCKEVLSEIKTLRSTLSSEYQTYLANIRHAYEEGGG